MTLDELISQPLGSHADMIRWHSTQRPHHCAIVCDDIELGFAEFDRRVDAVAARLQQANLEPGDIVAMCANTGVNYLVAIFGCVRAGVAFTPLAPSATPEHRNAMLENTAAKMLCRDRETENDWRLPTGMVLTCVALDDSDAGTAWTE